MKLQFTSYFTTSATVLLLSCGVPVDTESKYDYGGTNSADAEVDSPKVTKSLTCGDATLMNNVAKVFSNNCIRCHGPSPAPNAKFGKILDLEHIIKIGKVNPGKPGTSIILKAIEDGTMPPTGSALSSTEVRNVKNWIKEGAPYTSRPEDLGEFVADCDDEGSSNDNDDGGDDNDDDDGGGNAGGGTGGTNGGGNSGGGSGDSLALQTAKILNDNCASCHDNGSALGGLGTITDLQNLLDDGYVTASDSGDSELFERMTDTNRPMPPKGIISVSDLNVIEQWIRDGADVR